MKIELEDLALVATFLFEWIVENMLVPGRIETWILLIDMDDVGISNLPNEKLLI